MEMLKVDIDKIKPYEKNAKLHPQEQIEQIKQSIQEFGNNDPIAIDEDFVIIEGHGRYTALKELGYKEVDCILLKGMTKEQKDAYRLVHNKLTMNSDFDLEMLVEELELLDIDMEKYDFEFTKLQRELEKQKKKELVEDEFNELPDKEECEVKEGQVYQLGRHKLMCGDSTNPKDVKRLVGGVQIDLIFTDPPYNVNISNSQGMQIENDNLPEDEFEEFLQKAFDNAGEVVKFGGAFYVWLASSGEVVFRNCLANAGLSPKQEIIWVKNHFNWGRQDYKWMHEPCIYGWKEGAAHYFIEEHNNPTVIEDELDIEKLKKEELKEILKDILYQDIPTSIIKENKPLINDLHPTMKPVRLCGKLIQNSSREKENVLDLFGGSGSTLIACEQINRNCYMMEYDPYYADVIIKRWEKFTGCKAKLIG